MEHTRSGARALEGQLWMGRLEPRASGEAPAVPEPSAARLRGAGVWVPAGSGQGKGRAQAEANRQVGQHRLPAGPAGWLTLSPRIT